MITSEGEVQGWNQDGEPTEPCHVLVLESGVGSQVLVL